MQASQSTLPALGAPFNGGIYAGITTGKDGVAYALVLLPDTTSDQKWQAAMDWAKGLGADLPTRPEAALLFANVRSALPSSGWGWTNETHESEASFAWYCFFGYGSQTFRHKVYEGAAVAVRRLALESFNPFEESLNAAVAASAAMRRAALGLIAAADKADAAAAQGVPA